MAILRGIFKMIKWMFGFSKQYHVQQRQYRKSGIVGKIFTTIFWLGLCGLSIWLEIVNIKLFSIHFGWAILLAVFTVSIIYSLIKTAGVYSVIAFLNIIHSTVESTVEKKAKEELTRNYQVVNGEIVGRDEALTDEQLKQENIQVKKQHRWLDIGCGILFGIACLGLLVGSIVLLFMGLQGKII